jgi:hypothetical protein
MYKLLIESSARFRSYKVTKGIIEFVEPDEQGRIRRLELEYEEDELRQLIKLIGGIWARIQSLDLPLTDQYPPTIAGIKKFEADLSQ